MALGSLWWLAWAGVDGVDAAAFCVAGVALGDMDLHFAWQAWHLVTWIVTLRGRCGTYGTGLALAPCLGRSGRGGCHVILQVPRKVQGDMDLHFASATPATCKKQRIVHFAWQAWHLWHWAGSGGALGSGVDAQLVHTPLTHTQLTHSTLSHTTLSHTTLLHTQTYTHTTLSHTALSPNLSCTISFPSCLSHRIFTSAW